VVPYRCAISTHSDELVPEPSSKKILDPPMTLWCLDADMWIRAVRTIAKL